MTNLSNSKIGYINWYQDKNHHIGFSVESRVGLQSLKAIIDGNTYVVPHSTDTRFMIAGITPVIENGIWYLQVTWTADGNAYAAKIRMLN